MFLDLAKAFNSISLEIFIQKSEKYGFGENARVLLNSFLINRKQCVRNGIVESDWANYKSWCSARYCTGTTSIHTLCK